MSAPDFTAKRGMFLSGDTAGKCRTLQATAAHYPHTGLCGTNPSRVCHASGEVKGKRWSKQ